jgi:glutamyl-tRNA reductase
VTADVAPTISALQRRADQIIERLLQHNESRWESLSDADRERLEAMVRAVASRLLREPVLRLEASQGEKSLQYTRALGELFGFTA